MSLATQPATEPTWFKSSYSGGNATECVEAASVAFTVLVRDSKSPGQHLTVSTEAWARFLTGVHCR